MATAQIKNFLTDKHVEGLKTHKYSAVDNSPFSRIVMQPYWNWLVNLVPLWMAPNLITFIGLVMNIFCTMLVLCFMPNFSGEAPQWCYLMLALSVFVYQSLDAIDGKQARRTGTSSPLGELFDHGCDAYNCMLLVMGSCLTMGSGATALTYYLTLVFMFAFYTAHWKTFITGTLDFGMIDVTEGQLVIVIAHLASYFCGPSVWDGVVYKLEGDGATEFTVRDVIALLAICSSLQNALANLYVIFITNDNPTVAQTSVAQPSIAFGIVTFMSQYTYYFAYEELFVNHTSLYIMTFGTVMAKITCMLVIAHMSKQPMPYFDKSFTALVGLCINARFNFINHYYALVGAFVYVTLSLLFYSFCVITQLCRELDIWCFRIKPKADNKKTK